MKISRRQAIGTMAAAAAWRPASAQTGVPPIASGPFKGTRESLQAYEVPEWFRDAKFGIWAHWGPQSAPEDGDWYARNMYMEGSPQYKFHVAKYGHPSKFGFKDVIGTWTGDRFDAEHLVGLYKDAGAKYFVSMGVHHDNFDMWNSKYQRWNAVNMGPKKDVVGLFHAAARKNGMKFGVSEHLWISYKWFAVNHGADKTGPRAGVPYDGVDPKFADLYHDYSGVDYQKFIRKLDWNDNDIPDRWKLRWFQRIQDLVDSYQPDLLYTDGALPFEEYGLNLVAHFYNNSAAKNGGRTQAVYNSKRQEDCTTGTCVLDVERGVVDKIWPSPWQTDTCIGDWHYKKGIQYKTPKTVIDMLADIVSRNGNLLLNFPLPNSGMLDPAEREVLAGITQWMRVNSEGIYGTRPWKIYGEGPSTTVVKSGTAFNESKRTALAAEDVRFTSKGRTLYAFVMGWPQGTATVKSLAQGSADKIANVELLGHGGPLKWTQEQTGLAVNLPAQKPSEHAVTLKVTWA